MVHLVRGVLTDAGDRPGRHPAEYLQAKSALRPNQWFLVRINGSVVITSRDVEGLFGVSQRTARNILSSWVSGGFVLVVDPARKSRSYRLSPEYEGLGPS